MHGARRKKARMGASLTGGRGGPARRAARERARAAALHALQPGRARLRGPDVGAAEPGDHARAALRQLHLPSGRRGARGLRRSCYRAFPVLLPPLRIPTVPCRMVPQLQMSCCHVMLTSSTVILLVDGRSRGRGRVGGDIHHAVLRQGHENARHGARARSRCWRRMKSHIGDLADLRYQAVTVSSYLLPAGMVFSAESAVTTTQTCKHLHLQGFGQLRGVGLSSTGAGQLYCH